MLCPAGVRVTSSSTAQQHAETSSKQERGASGVKTPRNTWYSRQPSFPPAPAVQQRTNQEQPVVRKARELRRWCLCCMSAWHALATVLVATANVVLSFSCKPSLSPTLLPHSSSSAQLLGYRSTTRHTAHARHRDRAMEQGSSLWWRRHRKESPGVSIRLSPVDTGVPETAPHNVGPADSSAVGASAQEEDAPRGRSNRSGLLLLSTVPLVWGTYAPSVKYLYQMGESTPGLVFNFACYAVSVLTLAVVAGISSARKRKGGFESLKHACTDVYTEGWYTNRHRLPVGNINSTHELIRRCHSMQPSPPHEQFFL